MPMGEADRDKYAALLGAFSHARLPPSDNSGEGGSKEEDLALHDGQYTSPATRVNLAFEPRIRTSHSNATHFRVFSSSGPSASLAS